MLIVEIDIDNFKFIRNVFQVAFLNIRLYKIQVKSVILYVYTSVYLNESKKISYFLLLEELFKSCIITIKSVKNHFPFFIFSYFFLRYNIK